MPTIDIPYIATPKQRLFHTSTANETLFGGAAGGGKFLNISTLIPTTNGWVRMGDIQVGDKVFGHDGKPYPVTRVSPIELHEGYRFTFDDGSTLEANDEHLWLTYDAKELAALTRRSDEFREARRAKRPSRVSGSKSDAFTKSLTKRNAENPPPTKPAPTGTVRTTAEIVATLRFKNRSNHAIPVTKPIELPEGDFPFDPYLLGLWLGDGTKTGGRFTGIDGLEKAFEDAGFRVTHCKDGKNHGIHGLMDYLRATGVLNNKHIPNEYLWGSVEQRLSLLQGLMDTDGCCNKDGGAEFCNTNKNLAEGVAFLVRSLGMKCSIRESRAKLYGKDCGAKWTVLFTPSLPVFRLQRKLDKMNLTQRRTTKFRYIVSAERLEPLPMRCIAIDSPDHLYLAGESFVPTHNSVAIVLDALMRCLQYPGSKAYIFRKTYPELEGSVIQEALRWYPKEIATYNVGRHEMVLINKSRILFRHCASIANMYDYSGAEIHWLYLDELTSFEKEIFEFLKTRLRARKSLGLTPVVRCASNPGNIGHGWVKQYFVDAAPYGTLAEHTVKSKAAGKERIFTTQYIPALATDNPYITDDYLFELERKPEALRRALLYGDWDAFEGQVFIEWKNDPKHYDDRLWTHVITPFKIPVNWPRYMGFDHGYSKPFSLQWWAIGPDGCAYLYREWYGCREGQANVGIKLSPRQIVDGIIEREAEDEAKENIVIDRVAGIDTFDRSRGDSIAMQMEPVTKTNALGVVTSKLPGVFFRKCDNARIAGKMQFHERLRFDKDGRPLMQVMNTCKDFIRTIPNLPYDEKNPEDVNSKAEDHGYDAGRMVLMARPCPMRSQEIEIIKPFDPFTSRRK